MFPVRMWLIEAWLTKLGEKPGVEITQGELSELCGLSRQSVNFALRDLEKVGRVKSRTIDGPGKAYQLVGKSLSEKVTEDA